MPYAGKGEKKKQRQCLLNNAITVKEEGYTSIIAALLHKQLLSDRGEKRGKVLFDYPFLVRGKNVVVSITDMLDSNRPKEKKGPPSNDWIIVSYASTGTKAPHPIQSHS